MFTYEDIRSLKSNGISEHKFSYDKYILPVVYLYNSKLLITYDITNSKLDVYDYDSRARLHIIIDDDGNSINYNDDFNIQKFIYKTSGLGGYVRSCVDSHSEHHKIEKTNSSMFGYDDKPPCYERVRDKILKHTGGIKHDDDDTYSLLNDSVYIDYLSVD